MRRLIVIATAVLLIGLFLVFFILRLAIPSDGARLQPGTNPWQPDGVIVTPLIEHPGGLRAGDVVVAVEGVSLQQWAADMLSGRLDLSNVRPGDTLRYEVRRDAEMIVLRQQIGPYPLAAMLREDWGAVVLAVAGLAVAVFAFWRQPDDPAVQLLLLSFAAILGATTWSFGLQISDFLNGVGFILYYLATSLAFLLIWVFILHFLLVFPNRAAVLDSRRWIIAVIYALPFVVSLIWLLVTRTTAPSLWVWLSQFGQAVGPIQSVYVLLIILAAAASYRRARDPVARAQGRWVFFALILVLFLHLALGVIPELIAGQPLINWNLLALIALVIPLSIVIAILRYGLFDIELIIRRTTQYALVTGLLAIIYFSSVILLQRLLGQVTGEQSTVAVVLSTLLIAALFLPLRRRVQEVIDRRFFRRKYDAEKTLEAFATTVRNETDLDALTDELVRVIDETMQPKFVSVWLKPVNESKTRPHYTSRKE
jgi:two-component system, NarL family, sensor kinase